MNRMGRILFRLLTPILTFPIKEEGMLWDPLTPTLSRGERGLMVGCRKWPGD